VVGVGVGIDDEAVAADDVTRRQRQGPARVAVDPFEVDAEPAVDLAQRRRDGDGQAIGAGNLVAGVPEKGKGQVVLFDGAAGKALGNRRDGDQLGAAVVDLG